MIINFCFLELTHRIYFEIFYSCVYLSKWVDIIMQYIFRIMALFFTFYIYSIFMILSLKRGDDELLIEDIPVDNTYL